ncbi:MAG TPA: AraC family ligand binding domain-containing protein, partial [Pyrinomonadaceae bacterium]|nr:AraC family ligand binding domain-containing protein [Pyrinomonadaceae bacterium]
MRRHLDSLYGTLLKSSEVAGFTLMEIAYTPNLRLPTHSHRSAYFCLVLHGGFTECYGRNSRACRPSTLIFHPSGERHSDYFHAPARCFNLIISVPWLERVREHSTIVNGGADFRGGVLPHLAMKVYREFRQADGISPLIVEGLMLEILGEASRQSIKPAGRTPPPWLVRALGLLRDRFRENLSLTEIAGA